MTAKRKGVDNTIDFESSSWNDFTKKEFNDKQKEQYAKFMKEEIILYINKKATVPDLEEMYDTWCIGN